jgi:hypothetical protein
MAFPVSTLTVSISPSSGDFRSIRLAFTTASTLMTDRDLVLKNPTDQARRLRLMAMTAMLARGDRMGMDSRPGGMGWTVLAAVLTGVSAGLVLIGIVGSTLKCRDSDIGDGTYCGSLFSTVRNK